MAQRVNHIRTEQKPNFNGKDHLKILLFLIIIDPQPGSNRPQAINSPNRFARRGIKVKIKTTRCQLHLKIFLAVYVTG